MKKHTCTTPKGLECIAGSLYDDQRRKPRPICPCSCHRRKGDAL